MMVVILLAMIILIGLAFVTDVANTKASITTKRTVSNQTVNISSAMVNNSYVNTSINFSIYSQSAWKQNECALSSVSLKNSTGVAWTLNTDYLLYASAGKFSLKNTSKTVQAASGNNTYAYYTHCPDNYLTSSTDRGLSGLWPTLMIIVIIGAAVGAIARELRR